MKLFERGAVAGIGIALVVARSAWGQISSEEAPRKRTVPVREEVKWELEHSPFHLGPLKVRPIFEVRDLGWNNNVFGSTTNQVSDWTATVSAGARGIVPLGSKIFVRGLAAPEYTWYQKVTERRNLGGTYGGGLLGLFNRLTFEASGDDRSSVTVVNSESEATAVQKTTRGMARMEVAIFRRLALFGGFDAAKTRYDDKGATEGFSDPIDLLDRTETAWRGGLRYRFSEQIALGAQVERTRASFVREAFDRDNESTGYLLVARYDRPRFYLEASGGFRIGTARNAGSLYPDYRTGTYSFFASYFVIPNVELQLYGHRRPVDSFFLDNPYYFETRNTVVTQVTVGQRVTLLAYGTLGWNAYPVEVFAGSEIVTRRDDLTEYGGGFGFRFFREAVFRAVASESHYSSNIPGYGRTIFRFSTGISIKGDINR